MPVTVNELLVGDEPDAWRSAGFTVDAEDVCHLGTVRLRLTGTAGGRHLHGWSLRGLDRPVDDVDGVPTAASPQPPTTPGTHPNGVRRIDHLVLRTPDIDRTVGALGALGLEARRVRDEDSDRHPVPIRQVFFRMGEVILEVVGPQTVDAADAATPARLWGLALEADDIDGLTTRLGPDRVSAPRTAVQPGRRIATLRADGLGISTAIAFMTPAAGATR